MRAGPRPFDLPGRRRTWSYARSPCLNNPSLLSLGDSTVVLNPRAAGPRQLCQMPQCHSIAGCCCNKAKLQAQQLYLFITSARVIGVLCIPGLPLFLAKLQWTD